MDRADRSARRRPARPADLGRGRRSLDHDGGSRARPGVALLLRADRQRAAEPVRCAARRGVLRLPLPDLLRRAAERGVGRAGRGLAVAHRLDAPPAKRLAAALRRRRCALAAAAAREAQREVGRRRARPLAARGNAAAHRLARRRRPRGDARLAQAPRLARAQSARPRRVARAARLAQGTRRRRRIGR